MSTGTQQQLKDKAERFLQTLEIGATAMSNGRGQNTQTGHLIVIIAERRRGDWHFGYMINGEHMARANVLDLLEGAWVGKIGSA